jgi:hypothetical protein
MQTLDFAAVAGRKQPLLAGLFATAVVRHCPVMMMVRGYNVMTV